MNIIVVGCGKVGEKLIERLSSDNDHNITVVDLRQNIIREMVNEYDIMGVVGSGTSSDTLIEAGIKEADILIAVTGSDEINLLTCLVARKLGGCKTIARVRKPEYNKELNLFKEDLGLAMIINSEQVAANEISTVLRYPSAIQIDTFAKGRVEILKCKVAEGSPLDNMRIADMAAKLECNVLVCGIERGDAAFIPNGDFVIKSGDFISIVSSLKNSTDFFEKIRVKTNGVRDTIIVGGGGTAYYLAYNLLQSGVCVKIIEKDEARCEMLCQLLPKATIVCADGTDNRVLMEEGIEYAESVVALTNIDEENILLSLFAKSKTKGKLVTKINRIAYDNIIGNLGLDTIIYPKNITAEYIERFVRAKKNSLGSNIETMHLILDGKAEALEFRIKENSPVSDILLENLNLKKNMLIACINRGGHIIIPRGKDKILANDTVIVVTTVSGLKDISDILE